MVGIEIFTAEMVNGPPPTPSALHGVRQLPQQGLAQHSGILRVRVCLHPPVVLLVCKLGGLISFEGCMRQQALELAVNQEPPTSTRMPGALQVATTFAARLEARVALLVHVQLGLCILAEARLADKVHLQLAALCAAASRSSINPKANHAGLSCSRRVLGKRRVWDMRLWRPMQARSTGYPHVYLLLALVTPSG